MGEVAETPYRIYTLADPESKPELLVATDDVSVGEQLLYLRRHHVTDDSTVIGIMYRERDGEPGVWLVNPWASAPRFGFVRPPKVLDSGEST